MRRGILGFTCIETTGRRHFADYVLQALFFSLIMCHSLCLADADSTSAAGDEEQQSQAADTSDEEHVEPVTPDVPQAKDPSLTIYGFGASAGSSGVYVSLYSDHKARRVGDIVTIVIAESSKASKSASTKTNEKSGSNSNLSDLFGVGGLPLKMGTDAQSDYSGSGSTTRSGSMEATISAIVKEVLPNGNLLLEGTREVTVNDDAQTITVSGIVRPEAIGWDNSVLSTYIADAQITYVGEGPTTQRPGIITRILQTPFHWIASVFRRIF